MGRRHYLTDSVTMSDRERLLTVVTMFGCAAFPRFGHQENPVRSGWEWREENIRPGDLVQCQTQRTPNHWCVAWLEDFLQDTHWGRTYLLRELGGEGLCRMSNERVYALRGVPPYLLLEGLQWRSYVKVSKAISHLDRYHVRFQDLTFPDRHSRKGTIALRPHIFRVPRDMRARPIEVSVCFTARTRIRDLAQAIEDATPEGCWADRWEPEQRKACEDD